mmetsp:Transcript_26656/g.106784  ORF Transcript_26656/g.106784 Transcript_26656/m.106784 type:complete len:274 (+) Transcript_26656:123-944(+)
MSDSEPTLRPRPDPTWRAIACGGFHCVALRDDGRVVTWGEAWENQLADTPTDARYVAIACGAFHNVALRDDGRVVEWGRCDGDAPTDAGYVEIACGGSHSVARHRDGRVVTWGARSPSGQRDGAPTDAGYVATSRAESTAAARCTRTTAASSPGEIAQLASWQTPRPTPTPPTLPLRLVVTITPSRCAWSSGDTADQTSGAQTRRQARAFGRRRSRFQVTTRPVGGGAHSGRCFRGFDVWRSSLFGASYECRLPVTHPRDAPRFNPPVFFVTG